MKPYKNLLLANFKRVRHKLSRLCDGLTVIELPSRLPSILSAARMARNIQHRYVEVQHFHFGAINQPILITTDHLKVVLVRVFHHS